MLSGTAPTDLEQYMLELINRARANPAAEGQRLLNLAKTDPVLKQATAGWNLTTFDQTIASYPAEPPVAFNSRLIDAALAEDATMLAQNSQRHSPAGFLNNASVAVDTDGQSYYPTGSGSWATGENIFGFSQNVNVTSSTSYADYFEAGFLLDWGNPDFGHLKNILAPGPAEANAAAGVYPFNEVGVGLITNAYPTAPPDPNPPNSANLGLNVGPALVTQEFGWRQGNAFLTGTFYKDTASTGFYQPGEGLGAVTIKAVGLNGQGTFQTQTWSTGGYSLQLPAGSYAVSATGNVPGFQSKYVTIGQDNVAWGGGFSPAQLSDIAVPADYDNIGRSDIATYQPSSGNWFINSQTIGSYVKAFGLPGDIPVPGRYDGGAAELAVFRPSTATWYILGPNGMRVQQFGAPGDVPVPGNYDGPGKTDMAVYRPSNGTWYILHAATNTVQIKAFGIPGLDQPIQAAYDGGGTTEIAVLRPSTYQWFILGPNGMKVVQFGSTGEVPVPGDYDGLGKSELAVYQPSTATWYVWNSGDVLQYGAPGLDQPAPANYDGTGRADFATFRTGTSEWFVRANQGGTIYAQYGQGGNAQTIKTLAATTIPIPTPWVNWVGAPNAEDAHGNAKTTLTVHHARPRTVVAPRFRRAAHASGKSHRHDIQSMSS